jgi:hypothetical protein
VLVQIPEMSLDGTEISAQFGWELCEILVLHVKYLVQFKKMSMSVVSCTK